MARIKTFISTGSIRSNGPGQGANPNRTRVSGMVSSTNARASTAHVSQLRDTLYEPLVDKVGWNQSTSAAVRAAGTFNEAAIKIADKEARVAATETQFKISREVQDLLYERDDALYKKSGIEFLNSANNAKAEIAKIFEKNASSLSPAARNYIAGYVLSEQNRVISNIAKKQVIETNTAHDNIKTKALSDLTAGLGYVQSVGDLEQLIQATTSTILDVSPKDDNLRKTIARDVYNGAMESYLGVLSRRGTTPQQRIDSNNLALQYLEHWKRNPNHDETRAAAAERNIASGLYQAQNQLDADSRRDWNNAELASQKLYATKTAQWLKAYDEGDTEAMSAIELSVRDLAHTGQFKHLSQFSNFKQRVRSNFNEYDPADAQRALQLLDRTEDAGVMQEFKSIVDKLPPQTQITFMQSALGHRRQAISTVAKKAQSMLNKLYVESVPAVLADQRKAATKIVAQGVTDLIVKLKRSVTLPDGSTEYPDYNKVLRNTLKKFVSDNPIKVNKPTISSEYEKLLKTDRFEKTFLYLETGQYSPEEAEQRLTKEYARLLKRVKSYDGNKAEAMDAAIKYYLYAKQRINMVVNPAYKLDDLFKEY